MGQGKNFLKDGSWIIATISNLADIYTYPVYVHVDVVRLLINMYIHVLANEKHGAKLVPTKWSY